MAKQDSHEKTRPSTGVSSVPCPCGSLDLHMSERWLSSQKYPAWPPDLYFVDCRGCGSTGPPQETTTEAVSRWEEIHAANARIIHGKHEYQVSWRRESGKLRRTIYQTLHAAEDRRPTLESEEEHCYRYDPFGESCVDRQWDEARDRARGHLPEDSDSCVCCRGDFARDIMMKRRQVSTWEIIR